MEGAAPDLMRGRGKVPLQERLRPSWRRRICYSPLTYMLLVSIFIHLSMVTVFRVVVYLPYEQLDYYTFKIVPEGIVPQPTSNFDALQESTRPLRERDSLKLGGIPEAYSLPNIDLPTVEFAELERIRMAQQTLRSSSLYDRLYNNQERQDSWARFGRGMQRLGSSLAELALGEDSADVRDLDAAPPRILVRPAPGFEAEIVWSTGPEDRQLLFSPPIPALLQLDASRVTAPIELVLRVNASGKVTSIYSPQADFSELLEEIQDVVLRQYRFDPLTVEEGQPTTSLGTMRILPASEGME